MNYLDDKDKYMYLRGDELFDAVIYGNKDISETYPDDLNHYYYLNNRKEDIVEINGKVFVVKNGFGPFIWIAKIEKIQNLSLITFTWNNLSNRKFTNYFNGKMFSYPDSEIKKHYIKCHMENGINMFERDKDNFNKLCNELLYSDEYKDFIKIYYPELL